VADENKNLPALSPSDRELAKLIESHRKVAEVTGPVSGLLHSVKQRAVAKATKAEAERWQEQQRLTNAQTGVVKAYTELHDAVLDYAARTRRHGELQEDKLAGIDHQLEMNRKKRAQELSDQQHKTQSAQHGEHAFRSVQPELARMRGETLKAKERNLAQLWAKAEFDSETGAIDAQHNKRDAADAFIKQDAPAPPSPVSAPAAPPINFGKLQARLDALRVTAITDEQHAALDQMQHELACLMAGQK